MPLPRLIDRREAFKAFVPASLPPRPPVDWTPALRARFDAALLALGRLDALTDLLPNAALLLYAFVRKEAVLSSMIEGTQSSLALSVSASWQN
jgi:cell filamentation protein, protein adenylyltransferase